MRPAHTVFIYLPALPPHLAEPALPDTSCPALTGDPSGFFRFVIFTSYYTLMDIDYGTIYSHSPIRISKGSKENEGTSR
jgi:hypothetical protein